ncbi:hypothetical protein FDP41_013787 [Naegleria fowleri]|uniref:Peptidase S8/S53 domain-containing protein n=1 Tax=Naegleria fowleri TaxID=5763 RepID=A0A6A5C2L7_NAEFO|nr:uncharacterized protein FDP41_013787 [Naegleria fowleri]KAF0980138.1 hypothetical protein FDP41_013787 [Naegleria fowleri]
MGILGNGQIVGLSDSGIDWDNCLFRDANNPIVKTNSVNMNHRKIVGYDTVSAYSESGFISSDGQDEVDGHGTHVAGSICGSIQNLAFNSNANPINEYHGIAPNSRLYFVDLKKNWKSIYCVWKNPKDGYKEGQNVSDETCQALFGSDSCCSISNQYNSLCQDVDQTLWDYQDSVILFCCGGISSKGNTESPATAKNVIAVGASLTSNSAFEESVYYEDFKNNIQNAKLPFSTPDECCAYTGKNQEFVRAVCCPSAWKNLYTSNPSTFNEFNLAFFSSKGPAVGNSIKPDVTGISYNVVSAHSDGDTTTNQCGTISPALGNSAALMTSMDLGSPNSYEGFGRVYLGSLLQNQDGTPLNILVKEQSFKSISNSLKLCFKRVNGNNAIQTSPIFKVTLAWYDYPGSVAVVPQLLSDLNLFINTYVINTNVSKLSVIAGNYGNQVDTTNNVERMVEELPHSSLKESSVYVSVAVYVTSILKANRQPFALLITYPKEMFEAMDPTNPSCLYTTDFQPLHLFQMKLLLEL